VKIEQVVLDMKGTATFTFRFVAPSSGGRRRGAPDAIGMLLSVGVPCANRVTSTEAAAAWSRLRDLSEGWAKFIDAMVKKTRP
jgi:hypothetical protein